jgi:hypothetical protein
MATTIAVPQRAAPQPAAAQAPASTASTSRDWFRILQLVLFTAGALLMPAGVVAIMLGWYGTAHTKYQYNQLPYVVSGGLLGLALVFIGGFLYFGAWVARVASDQRESARQLADALIAVSDLVARQSGGGSGSAGSSEAADPDMLVLAGAGSTVHRRDCPLIAHRNDLHELKPSDKDLGTCRVCRPSLV